MRIALIGYGKMGKEIEKIALERNHTIVTKIDIDTQNEFTAENMQKADVAIEFTQPEMAIENIRKCFAFGIPVVSGTTGWHNQFDKIQQECISANQTLFYSSNYSLGVNLFFKLNQYLAELMNQFPQYEVSMEETHHIQKLDAPSGTAVSLAEGILKHVQRKKQWQLNGQDNDSKLNITAIRRDTVPGIHTIKYESDVDYIEITHSAKSRKGLALGAVIAAEFLKDKKGVYSMEDLLKII